MSNIVLRILETPQELGDVELLQRAIWPDADIEVIPVHLLLASVRNGGLIIGAYEPAPQPDTPETEAAAPAEISRIPQAAERATPVGFVFSFPGVYNTADGLRIKHHSHNLGVLPSHEDRGIGFLLKRAQWQMVRRQGIDRITWTYDPLLSRNAQLNISRLGAVCNTYFPSFYGELRDGLNVGFPTDRFQVDWWIASKRVARRLSKRPRLKLDLAHYLAADTPILNPSTIEADGLPHPHDQPAAEVIANLQQDQCTILLLEIPSDFAALKAIDSDLALEWRLHSRALFLALFELGYLVTDFIHLKGTFPRSFYVLSHGDSTL